MKIELGQVTLKSGEQARLVQIVAPEPEWASQILPFLAHKGHMWLWPMEQALTEGLPGIRMNFYLLILGEEVLGNITTVESLEPPLSMLQHVFTNPDHRRKGICQLLMQALCDDFRSRGGRAMYLGTGYDTPPFWIYHSFGFRGIGTTGAMKWLPEEEFDKAYFAPGQVSARDTEWADWGPLEALYLTEGGWYLRGLHFGHYGHSSYEGTYPVMREAMTSGDISEVKVLAKSDGAVMGHAFITTQSQWQGNPYLLDFFAHPHFEGHSETLLAALNLPTDRKLQCYCDELAKTRAAALEAAGFVQEAVLKRQIQKDSDWLDVLVYSRG